MLEFNKLLLQDVSMLFEIVEEVTGISQEQIRSRSRKRDISDARMMMCESLRRNSRYRLQEIGSVVCNLDHSTVIHYKNKLPELYVTDYDFKKKFITIDVRFKQIKDGGTLPLTVCKVFVILGKKSILTAHIYSISP